MGFMARQELVALHEGVGLRLAGSAAADEGDAGV